MSNSILLARFSIAGLVNTGVGYLVIFCCMRLGLSPIASNVLGYAVGLVISFLQSRHWVFRSAGKARDEGLRFIAAFLVAYGANLVTLQVLLAVPVNAYLAQALAGGIYFGTSFVLNSRFVFRKRSAPPPV